MVWRCCASGGVSVACFSLSRIEMLALYPNPNLGEQVLLQARAPLAGLETRDRHRGVPADLRMDSLTTVPSTPQILKGT
ncbi:hypothetical protein PoB_002537600 [Plakobranchus ocellatus]|uniref:Uncharacterized protein n=1 Tax=Plakobranchus ocellatus TaxID=259542 RepID=A0AAV3ZIC2_9GAST|nr:hypothetical protein PoB_002537600 [Plakobranchus ocellatus]